MRGADASAGTIKSGGATGRTAQVVMLDVDHPDIVEFVTTKAREEEKVRALRDAGFDIDLGGKHRQVQYQNANNSVRVCDEFMRAVEKARSSISGSPHRRGRRAGDARELMPRMAEAAWACADPGIQDDGTMDDWHTAPSRTDHREQPLQGVRPPGQLLLQPGQHRPAEVPPRRRHLRRGAVRKVTELIITAMDISICFADFPTEKIADTTRAYRQLGIGYANLGALLMATGHAYDSEGGRAIAASITSLMTGAAYKTRPNWPRPSAPTTATSATPAAQAGHPQARGRQREHPPGRHDGTRDPDRHETWQECIELGETNGYRKPKVAYWRPQAP